MRGYPLIKTTKELILVEFRLFLREPITVFFTVFFPFIPLLLFGTIFGDTPVKPGFRAIDFLVPATIAMVVGYLGLMWTPIAISEYREQGVLKRYKVSPLPLWNFFLAYITVQFALLLVVSLLLATVAKLIFDIRFGGNPGLITMGMIVSSISMSMMGFMVVGICSSPRMTQALGSVLFFAMLFMSGAAIPRMIFPAWLQEVTNYVPLTHVVDMLTGLWIGEPLRDQLVPLVVLFGIAVAAFLIAKLTYQLREFG